MNSISDMKFSKFNIYTKDRDGNLLLSNTISNIFVRIHKEKYIEPLELNESLMRNLDDETIKLFIRYGILVDRDKNETYLIDDIYKSAVRDYKRLDMVILTTNQCNFSCVYCFQKREPDFLNFKQLDTLLSFIESKIDEYGYENIKIRWFGGEPLLNLSGILYFSDKINQLRKKKKFTYGCGIISNGYLLDLETFRQLYKNRVVTYQITIDGLPGIKYRVLNNGEETFYTIINNLKLIRDNVEYSMFSITIRINFTRELVERAEEIVELLYKEFGNDKRFSFSFIPVFDWSYKDTDYMRAEQLKKELVHEKDVTMVMKKYSGKLDFKAWSNLMYAHNNCWAGTKHGYAIDANGDILKCEFKLEGFDENKVGNISKEGIITFDPEKEKKWIFDNPLPECYDCACFPLCLSTSCGAARQQGIMSQKCGTFMQQALDYLEIESYSRHNHFVEVFI